MADPLGNGFRCHSLYCSLIFFISFPSLFPYLFMMFAVIGSGLSGHAAEILISFLFPSCLFSSPRSLPHTSFVFLSLTLCPLQPPPPHHWYQRRLCWLIALLSGTFPLPFFIPLSSRCLVSPFTGLSILYSVSLWVFLLCSQTLSTQTPLFKPDSHEPGADGGMYRWKSHSICLKWQLFRHAKDSLQDCMSGRIINEAQDQSTQTEFQMILAVPTVQTVIKIRSTSLPSAITPFQKLLFTFKIAIRARWWCVIIWGWYSFIVIFFKKHLICIANQ